MNFELEPEHQAIADVAHSVATKLAPDYVVRERAGAYPWPLLEQLGQAGLLGLNVPEEAGGQGAGELVTGVVCEILARADYAAALLVLEAGSGAKLLHWYASDQVRSRWLAEVLAGRATVSIALTEAGAGSDLAAAVSTRARPDGDGGWVIDGEKNSMSFVGSQLIIVLAGTESGPGLFAVPADAVGVEVRPFDDLGGTQIGRSVVSFNGVEVPGTAQLGEFGRGVGSVLRALGSSKVLVSAAALGAARASLEDAIAWTTDRRSFGDSLAAKQGAVFPLVDWSTQLEAAWLLICKTLWLIDHRLPYEKEAAMVKAWVPALAARICHHAIISLGHVGYSREHPAQARLRDVIGAELGEGTSNIQRGIAARHLTGVSAL